MSPSIAAFRALTTSLEPVEFSYAQIHHALARAFPDRPALIWRDRTWTYADIASQADRLAWAISDVVDVRDPELGEPWECPNDRVALYLHNGAEYLIGMLGAWSARAVATNINYRYVEEELVDVLNDQQPTVIMYHGTFAERLRSVLPRISPPKLLLRVDDGTPDSLVEGARDFAEVLAGVAHDGPPRTDWSPSDRYILYTGGTTGTPKGVLWRQDDIMVTALGLTQRDGSPFDSLAAVVTRAEGRAHLRSMPLPPFMHGAAHWNALSTWLSGGTVVLPDVLDRFDAYDALQSCARHGASSMLIVGDAFALPIIAALEQGAPVPVTLRTILSSGAILSDSSVRQLHALLGSVRILDVLGSSESGRQGMRVTDPGDHVEADFRRESASVVLDDSCSGLATPGDGQLGWLAASGRVPLGYFGDQQKTAKTFPVIGGVRYSVPGDRAQLTEDGTIALYGRDSSVINSGGEKIFAEEVERALKEHPAVFDALVVGTPSEKWGAQVCAVISVGTHAVEQDADTLSTEILAIAAQHVARYKLPKQITFVADVPRSPSGKPDYRAARAML